VFSVFRAADGQLIFDAKPLGDGPPTAAYSSLCKGWLESKPPGGRLGFDYPLQSRTFLFDSETLTEPFGFGESLGVSRNPRLSNTSKTGQNGPQVTQNTARQAMHEGTIHQKTLPQTKSCNQRPSKLKIRGPIYPKSGVENLHKTGPQRPETLKYRP
jgi:hypothetical protein